MGLMRQYLGLLGVGLLGFVATAHGDDDPRELVRKMIDARGGDALRKVQAYELKLHSTVHQGDKKIKVDGAFAVRGFDRSRIEIRHELADSVEVFLLGRGWRREEGKTREMTARELEDARDGTYLSWVEMVYQITGPDFRLELLPESKEDSRRLVGVRVIAPPYPDQPKRRKKAAPPIEIWVDAETHLVARQRHRFKNADGEDVTMDARYSDHKRFDGILIPTQSVTHRNGKKWLETEVMNAKFFQNGDKVKLDKP